MNNYTPEKLSEASKKAARFIQRTRWVMNLQKEVKEFTKTLESIARAVEGHAKTLAIAEFKYKQAEENKDPRLVDLKASYESAVEDAKRQEKETTQQTKECEESINECNDKMAKVMSGDLKVNAVRQTEIAKELVHSRVEEAHKNGEFDQVDR